MGSLHGKPTLRVLVIDDDKDNAESISTLVSTHGYDAISVSDGDLIDVVRSFRPDVILLDQSGLGLAKRLHDDRDCHAEIVAINGYHDENHQILSILEDKLRRRLRDLNDEDLLFAEADVYFHATDREFTEEDVERLRLIRAAYAKYNYFGGSSIVARYVRDLPEAMSREALMGFRAR